MTTTHTTVLGLMSGTSLDGLDLALCEFSCHQTWNYKILSATTIKYPQDWIQKIKDAETKQPNELGQLSDLYATYISEQINAFLKNTTKPDLIASHGHTIFHEPHKGITLQIGNGQVIANNTGITTIADFRTKDVKLGGQGAPLVPIGDELLFENYDYCLNLGGFCNISYKFRDKRIAFDICPVNIVLNMLTQEIGFEYDNNGDFGKKGKVNKELLKKLNALPFYDMSNPKSLGKEWVIKNIVPLLNEQDISISNKLRTFYEHIAIQISNVINAKNGSVFITGGGAHNSFLIKTLQQHTSSKIIIPEPLVVDYKEALIFGFLGLLRYNNQINCLSSVTGASNDSSCGEIFYPCND